MTPFDARRLAVFRGRWDLVQVLRTNRPEHKALEGRSLADLARDTGKHPVDAWLDLVGADGLDVEFLAGLLNTDEKVVGDLIVHPLTLITLSDAAIRSDGEDTRPVGRVPGSSG